MVVHVWERAMEADIGPVVVACADTSIAEAVERFGGRCVMTGSHHVSGSDRIGEALEKVDPQGNFDKIVNLQADFPTINPSDLSAAVAILDNPQVDIGSLVALARPEELGNPNVIKVAVGFGDGDSSGRALYFSRSPVPGTPGPIYHHIGLYAYQRAALVRFIGLPPSRLEQREKLEQLRALEAGMRIDITLVDSVPDGVDTPADLERARTRLEI